MIKVNLSELAVGVGSHPWLNPEGKLVGSAVEIPSGQPSSSTVSEYEHALQRCNDNRRDGVVILPETYRYLEEAKKPYSPGQVERVDQLGTRLVQKTGSFVNAGIQIQELGMRTLQRSLSTVEEYIYLYPAIADKVMEIFTNGANPWMRTQKEHTGESDTLPHQRSMTSVIIKTLLDDVDEGFLFFCHRASVPDEELLFPTSTGAAVKRNPDRTISAKLRIISDLRRVNRALRKEEIFPATTPTIQQIATRVVVQLSRLFPGTEILLSVRDIAKAFKLIPSSPHLMRCLCHGFKAEVSRASSDIVGCFLSLPCGWVA